MDGRVLDEYCGSGRRRDKAGREGQHSESDRGRCGIGAAYPVSSARRGIGGKDGLKTDPTSHRDTLSQIEQLPLGF